MKPEEIFAPGEHAIVLNRGCVSGNVVQYLSNRGQDKSGFVKVDVTGAPTDFQDE